MIDAKTIEPMSTHLDTVFEEDEVRNDGHVVLISEFRRLIHVSRGNRDSPVESLRESAHERLG